MPMKKKEIPKKEEIYKVYTDKPKTDLEKWIHSKSNSIMDVYGIGRMNLNFCGEVNKNKEGYGGSLTIFSVNYDKIYKAINLTIYDLAQDLWRQGNKDFLLTSLIHEFAHVLTTDLASAAFARYITKKEILSSVEELTESIAMLARELYALKNIN